MGQAKQRGTFAERLHAAYDRIARVEAGRKEHLRLLAEVEEESESRTNQMLEHFIRQTLEQASRQMPLMTADFTLIEGFGKVAADALIKAEIKKAIEADLAAI